MGASFDHMELGNDSGRAKGSVHPNSVGEKDIPRASLEERGGKSLCEVSEQRREIGIRQVVPVGIEQVGWHQPGREY